MRLDGFSQLVSLHDGRLSQVFRAVRQQDKRPVILKVLRGPRPSPEAVAGFRREHELMTSMAGSNIVTCLDYIEAAEPIIVLHDDGAHALAEALEDGPLPLAELWDTAEAVACALSNMHDRGILHKDITPSNIIRRKQPAVVKVIDFGVATRQAAEEMPTRSMGRLVGSLPYLAPEQTGRMNRTVDVRSDLYSLGATLYTP